MSRVSTTPPRRPPTEAQIAEAEKLLDRLKQPFPPLLPLSPANPQAPAQKPIAASDGSRVAIADAPRARSLPRSAGEQAASLPAQAHTIHERLGPYLKPAGNLRGKIEQAAIDTGFAASKRDVTSVLDELLKDWSQPAESIVARQSVQGILRGLRKKMAPVTATGLGFDEGFNAIVQLCLIEKKDRLLELRHCLREPRKLRAHPLVTALRDALEELLAAELAEKLAEAVSAATPADKSRLYAEAMEIAGRLIEEPSNAQAQADGVLGGLAQLDARGVDVMPLLAALPTQQLRLLEQNLRSGPGGAHRANVLDMVQRCVRSDGFAGAVRAVERALDGFTGASSSSASASPPATADQLAHCVIVAAETFAQRAPRDWQPHTLPEELRDAYRTLMHRLGVAQGDLYGLFKNIGPEQIPKLAVALQILRDPGHAALQDEIAQRRVSPDHAAMVIGALQCCTDAPTIAAALGMLKDAGGRRHPSAKRESRFALHRRVADMQAHEKGQLATAMRAPLLLEVSAAVQMVLADEDTMNSKPALRESLQDLQAAFGAVRMALPPPAPGVPASIAGQLRDVRPEVKDALRHVYGIDIGADGSVTAGLPGEGESVQTGTRVGRWFVNADFARELEHSDFLLEGRPLVDRRNWDSLDPQEQGDRCEAAVQRLAGWIGGADDPQTQQVLQKLTGVANARAMADALKDVAPRRRYLREQGRLVDAAPPARKFNFRRAKDRRPVVQCEWRVNHAWRFQEPDGRNIALRQPAYERVEYRVKISVDGQPARPKGRFEVEAIPDPWSIENGTPWARPATAQQVLDPDADPLLRAAFKAFTEEEFSAENVEFVESFHEFDAAYGRGDSAAALLSKANDICGVFIGSNAAKTININGPLAAGIAAALRAANDAVRRTPEQQVEALQQLRLKLDDARQAVYNSIGVDPLADNFEGDTLPVLTERVRNHLRATESDTLPLTSNLFVHAAAVSVHVAGVEDPVSLGRITTQVTEFLARNEMEVGDKGTPLTFTLTRTPKDGLQKASWTISALDANGKVMGEAMHAATLPADARQSAYEATLAAAMVANLDQVRGWVAPHAE